MAFRYISIRQILDDILDHPMLKDLTFERAINHVVHFMRIVGMPDIFNEKTEKVEIKDYRGLLPCDFDKVIQVRMCGGVNDKAVFRGTTDSFHMSDNKEESFDFTYRLQGNIIFTSIKCGTIEIAYRSFEVDHDGFPMIPDSSPFIQALELYIKKKHFTVLFDQGKVTPQVYNNVCQEYAWYVGQAQSDLVRPTMDQMQSFTNMFNTLVPRTNEHSRGFINTGTKEKIRVQ